MDANIITNALLAVIAVGIWFTVYMLAGIKDDLARPRVEIAEDPESVQRRMDAMGESATQVIMATTQGNFRAGDPVREVAPGVVATMTTTENANATVVGFPIAATLNSPDPDSFSEQAQPESCDHRQALKIARALPHGDVVTCPTCGADLRVTVNTDQSRSIDRMPG